MKNQNEILEQIDQYLLGYMNQKESEVFNNRLKTDNNLQELTENQKVANMLVIGNRLKQVKDMMDEDFRVGKVKPVSNHFFRYLLIAGTIAIMIFGIILFNKKEKVEKVRKLNFPAALDKKETIVNETKINPGIKDTVSSMLKPVESQNKNQNQKLPEQRKDDLQEKLNKGFTTAPSIIQDSVLLQKKDFQQKTEIHYKKDSVKDLGKEGGIHDITTVKDSVLTPELLPKSEVETLPENTEVEIPVNSFSFKPEFGEFFNIPVKENDGDIVIMDRAGNKVYEAKLYSNRSNTWDGTTLQGGFASPNLYFYFINYENGKKENGQVIVY